jgi:hypothetical protein
MKNKIMDLLGFWYCDMCDRWNRKGQICWYNWTSIHYWEYLWMWIPCKFGHHSETTWYGREGSWEGCQWCDIRWNFTPKEDVQL